jgi:hypothetical protein
MVLAQSAQRTFPSAMEAAQDLFKAVQGNEEKAINNILGGPSDLTTAGDEAEDKADRQMFIEKYKEMHRVGREPDGSMTLYIGAENWPFPIPLVEKNGAWRFDPETGQKEVLFRRIGENELTAIARCHQFATDEKQHQAGGERKLHHGYYFQVLGGGTKGGFVMIAYPAEYRSSGVMTFVITDKDLLYEKDLGANTPALASGMTAFHKDGSWHKSTM